MPLLFLRPLPHALPTTYRNWKRADIALQLASLVVPFSPFPAVTFWTGGSFWSACMLVGCTQFLSGLLWFRGSRDYGMPIGRVLYYFTLLFAVMLALIVGWSRQSASLAMLALVLLLPALVVWYFVLTVREGRMVPLVKKSVLPSL